MGIYIGITEKKNVFYNFKPIAKIEGSVIYPLSQEEQKKILPESERLNICLTYNWKDDSACERMEEFFSENSLTIFEFNSSDLQPNIVPRTGERNETGYRVYALDMIAEKKIRSIEKEGIYYSISKQNLETDFENDSVVIISAPYVLEGDKVFIERDSFWAGPYTVGYNKSDLNYYVKPEIKVNKYTINGYHVGQMNYFNLSYKENRWFLLSPKKGANSEKLDVISDKVLIDSFKDSINSNHIINGQINLEEMASLMEQYEKSCLSSAILTDEIRKSRLARLAKIIQSEKDIDSILGSFTDYICNLIVKYQNSLEVEEWLKVLLKKNPNLLDNLSKSKIIRNHIESLENTVESLENTVENLNLQKDELETEIKDIRKTELINKQNEELVSKQKEYKYLLDRIEDKKNALKLMDDLDEIQTRKLKLNGEVNFLEQHKTNLQSHTNELELQFQEFISNQHKKMTEIAFDGFMASKILQAASSWETEQSKDQHTDLTKKIMSIQTKNKSPEELINYLCNTIKIYRPNYSRNIIINIIICITQGFLTVFSGEPGCGKTSICNIVGEVLGLNKISSQIDYSKEVNRYIAISVERGWTSKRDFVGYYNPLSKTFDKSNREVYDALYQLDTEKQAGINNLPYIILLDEANLSPMEYYWSDFMNICDDLGPNSKVNLGENHIFSIPETLHFVATINNDHTTETLSPRLIDRSWIITLPQLNLRDYSVTVNREIFSSDSVDIISWESLKAAFIPMNNECKFSTEIQKCYEKIILKLREKHFTISPRIDFAIKKYWFVASKYFEKDDTETAADIVALDYAIVQRILPKIVGNGEDFEQWLKELGSLFSNDGLNMSASMIKDIIERGNQHMKYYQFFC